MKKPKHSGKQPRPQPPDVIRHYESLPPDETDEVVETVVDMIVNFQRRSLDSRSIEPGEREPELDRLRRGPRPCPIRRHSACETARRSLR
ncbi:MAG: hypothetical protein ACE5HV_17370, partial [Acidobacteriota bacterium]